MRVLITGAQGQLGRAVIRRLADYELIPCARADLDITDPEAVRRVIAAHHPDCIINCAAYTDVDGAERHPDLAAAVNGEAVRHLAIACREAGAVLAQISTDYVFDGRKPVPYTIHDRPNPISVYGASKLRGEEHALELAGRAYVVRTSWLYGLSGRNFVETMLTAGRQRRTVEVVTDQRGAPTFADDLAGALAALVPTRRFGIYHVANQGQATWLEFARAIFATAEMDAEVRPITSDRLGRPARRPANSLLDPGPLEETIGYLLPPWRDALTRYVALRTVPA